MSGFQFREPLRQRATFRWVKRPPISWYRALWLRSLDWLFYLRSRRRRMPDGLIVVMDVAIGLLILAAIFHAAHIVILLLAAR